MPKQPGNTTRDPATMHSRGVVTRSMTRSMAKVTLEQQGAAQATLMPQQPGNITGDPVTMHPYEADTSGIAKVTLEQQGAAQATPMPQRPGNITGDPATMHPYEADTSGMAKVTLEQQGAAQATPVPQQPGNITRDPATMHPYEADTSGMAKVILEQQGAAQATPMPQQPGNITRDPAAMHPYEADTSGMAVRAHNMSLRIFQSRGNIRDNLWYNQNPGRVLGVFRVPDVRMKWLPFYKIIAEFKPLTLVHQNDDPMFITDIASLRYITTSRSRNRRLGVCILEETCAEEGIFSSSFLVMINDNVLKPLPGPGNTMVELTPFKLNPIDITWVSSYRRYRKRVVIVMKLLTPTDLLQMLQKKHSDHTSALIKEKLSDDSNCEIAVTSMCVSLICPLGKMRMTTPCKSQTCDHLQCFDALSFLNLNEQSPKWTCPVCYRPALYDDLVIDGYFQEVLISPLLPSECNEIQLLKDGSWTTHNNNNEPVTVENLTTTLSSIVIDDD